MSRRLEIAMFVHSLRSDWNNGNAHFLRGLARALGEMGHAVTCYEAESSWSHDSLLELEGERGEAALAEFAAAYRDLTIVRYHERDTALLRAALRRADVVLVHEWHSPEFISALFDMREGLACRMLFHDTHHRASSSPEQMRQLQVERFDGVLVFGNALRSIYRDSFGLQKVWTLHEAADTSIFFPDPQEKIADVVWIGNWGDGERSRELQEFMIEPAKRLPLYSFVVHGVRYPEEGRAALAEAGIEYRGYLPNLGAQRAYNSARLTLHVPRQQYTAAMAGIPTIRVFEALAAGIPLISAPWEDRERLFCPGDFRMVSNADDMTAAIEELLSNEGLARSQADKGLATVLKRHTCSHRAEELTAICEEVLQ